MRIDENGYKRGNLPHSDLIHRQVAYKEIYLKNKDIYDKPFSEYIVHHIDENKLNNDVSNLQIMTQEEHEELHGTTNFKNSPTEQELPDNYYKNKPLKKCFGRGSNQLLYFILGIVFLIVSMYIGLRLGGFYVGERNETLGLVFFFIPLFISAWFFVYWKERKYAC